MIGRGSARKLPYLARARIADNLFVQRKRLGCSQRQLGELAMVSANRVSAFENGEVAASLDLYVRLAGSLSITVGDLLDGVRWTPAVNELSLHAAYEVAAAVGSHGTRP